ncbi:MAG: potassium transporter Kup [Bacteriovoracia bacterium]
MKTDRKPHSAKTGKMLPLAMAALGVVYGDIGTSPLYAVRECFYGHSALVLTEHNVLGILSLFFWSLTLVIVVKYLTVFMRVHNEGEGGVTALMALLIFKMRSSAEHKHIYYFILCGLFGASLLFGDSMITPVISVLGAVEGLQTATPMFAPFVVPITVAVLIMLFLPQRFGTAKVGAVFGPVILSWFTAIGLLGLYWILQKPDILRAINPWEAIRFFRDNGFHGFLSLGVVVLCITGGEALYADMGHFGEKPIRMAWYRVVFPALLLNYFGQGAALLTKGEEIIKNPFFGMVPSMLLYPMVILATMAAVIASQALISGVFSLTHQLTALGFLPRFKVVHTSASTEGQIYIPKINQFLAISCIAITLYFQSSDRLVGAYGIAVTGTMVITSLLFFAVSRWIWEWSWLAAFAATGGFLLIDLSFLGANLAKIMHGGALPIGVGVFFFVLMSTWRKGRTMLYTTLLAKSMPIRELIDKVKKEAPARVKGTAIFMTPNWNIAPGILLHHLKHNKALHEQVVFLTILNEHVPSVPSEEHCRLTNLGHGLFQLVARYGYMQNPSVLEILKRCEFTELKIRWDDVSFFLGRETIILGKPGPVKLIPGQTNMWRWRKKLFTLMSRNAQSATAFFHVPPDHVIELGLQVKL